MAPSRPYDGCHGAGDGPPPQRAAGGGAERGSGGRAALRATATEASTPGEAAGSPAGARAAGEGSHGRLRGCRWTPPRASGLGWWRHPGRRHRLVLTGAVVARASGVAGDGGRGEEEGGEEVGEGTGEGSAGGAPAEGAQDGEDRSPCRCGESGACRRPR